ncbi:MAG: thiol-activated cytolysin family protein [Gemmatimonadales bacterium]
MRYLGLLSLACAALALGCDNDPSPTVTQDAPNITKLIDSSGKYAEGPELHDSAVTATDTVQASTLDSIDNLIVDTTWLEQTIHVSAADNPDQFMMFDPNAAVLWPGNLVQGQSIASGVPQAVPIADRAPATVFLAVVSGDSSGASNKFFRTVNQPSGSSITQAMNEILAGYHGGTPAKYSFSMDQVYSSSQVNFDLGLGYSGPAASGSDTFAFSMSNAVSRIAVRLTQQYFTMAMDDPQGAAGVFGPGVTAATLQPYVGPGNPLCYISSVTYGRVFILLYESTASSTDLQNALNFAYNGGVASGSIHSQVDFDRVMAETQVHLTQIGGDPASGLTLSDPRNYDSITAFLSMGADFSPSNVGAPISYTIKYLYDGTLVRMSSTMEYDYTARTPLAATSAPTSSTFSIVIHDLYINSSSDPNGSDPGMEAFVHVTDLVSGQARTTYTNWDPHDSLGLHFLGQNLAATGPVALNWTVPQFSLPNDGSVALDIQFEAAELDNNGAPYWEPPVTVYVRLVYDQAARRWKLDNGDGPPNFHLGTSGATDFSVDYSLKVNGADIGG